MDAEQLELDINSFQAVQTQHANGLKSILKNYTNLLQDYHRLKSDYEEARESREKYKKIVKEAVREL